MKKALLLKIVNPVLGTLFLMQALTGIFHEVIQGWSYEVWKNIHGLGGFVLVLIVIAHVYLNWNWIRSNIFPEPKGK